MSDNQTCLSPQDNKLAWDIAANTLWTVDNFVDNQRTAVITVLLASVMEGIFLALFTLSVITILRTSGKHLFHLFLLAALFVMFASTVFFWAGVITTALDNQRGANTVLTELHSYMNCRPTDAESASKCENDIEGHYFNHRFNVAPTFFTTAALVTVMVVGDAIVWWRAIAIYPYNGTVKAVGAALVLSTLVLGLENAIAGRRISTQWAIPPGNYEAAPNGPSESGSQILESSTSGLAAVILSFCTNVIATSLVIYKAWRHRREVSKYLEHVHSKTVGAGTVLAILAESGIIYCAVWLSLIVFLVAHNKKVKLFNVVPDGEYVVVLSIAYETCLIPIVAIYPTIIILIVAMKKSTLENVISHTGLPSLACTRDRSGECEKHENGDVNNATTSTLAGSRTRSLELRPPTPPPKDEEV